MTDKIRESAFPEPDVGSLPRDALIALWIRLYDSPPPPRLSQTFLRRFLAFELQVRAEGPLPRSATNQLARLAAGKAASAKPVLKPGGRYLREWNGVTHVVDVTEQGYLWKGQTHQSLSAIARAITGAHWSGPRFFGARNDPSAKNSASKRRAQ